MIPISQPYLTKEMTKYAQEVIDTGFLSRNSYNTKVENMFCDLLGVKHTLLVNSGTSANVIMDFIIRTYTQNPHIILPNNVYYGAVSPFITNTFHSILKTDKETWNPIIDPYQVTKSEAIFLAVHNLGNPINVPKLLDTYSDLKVIEDNCEGLFGKYGEDYTGSKAWMSSFSFYGNKIITSGEGGLVTTNDTEIYNMMFKYHGQGMSTVRYIHDQEGYNYRMTNIQAALLYGQLLFKDEIIEQRQEIFDYYRNSFSHTNELSYQKVEEGCTHANWIFGLRIKDSPSYVYAEQFFTSRGIEIRPMFYGLHKHKHLPIGHCYDNFDSEEIILLPTFVGITKNELEYIVNTVYEYLSIIRRGSKYAV